MGKLLRRIAIALVLAAVGGLLLNPLSAVVAEPFWQGILDFFHIDPRKWAAPAMSAVLDFLNSTVFRFGAMAAIGFAAGVWSHWIATRIDFRRRTKERLATESDYSFDPAREAPDPDAFFKLVDFTVRHILPTCDRLIEVQEAVVGATEANDQITQIAKAGMHHTPTDFWRIYHRLEEDINQSEPNIRFGKLIDLIREMELRGYSKFRSQGEELAKSVNIDIKTHPATATKWTAWNEAHKAMVSDYESIRTDIRYSKIYNRGGRSLFWSRKKQRWGDVTD